LLLLRLSIILPPLFFCQYVPSSHSSFASTVLHIPAICHVIFLKIFYP
jgi:hypothetical protein